MKRLINWLFRKRKSSTRLPPVEEHLEHRLPVWDALADLWLEKTPDIDAIAAVLSKSPYSIDQIAEICLYEVGPHVYDFQADASGFDQDWLSNRILNTMQQPDWYAWVWDHRKQIMAQAEVPLKGIGSAMQALRRRELQAAH